MASEPIYKVFVSSTFRDLRAERAEVQKALLKLNCLPVGMELFPAADDDTWDFIKEQINDSDYYVVLVAGRYGSLAPDDVSFTEKEYDYAREREIPSIGFVHADRDKIPSGETDSDPSVVQKLDAFVAKIKRRPVREFLNPHQLALEVTTSFVELKRTKPRIGFVRTNEVVDYRKYAELLERNIKLKKQLNDMRDKMIPEAFPDHAKLAVIRFDEKSSHTIYQVTITWSSLFVAIAEIILTNGFEEYILNSFRQLLSSLPEKIEADTTKMKFNFADPIEEELQAVKQNLFALDLIDVGTEQVQMLGVSGSYSRGERFWKLTNYGRQQFALLRAIVPALPAPIG